MVVRFQVGGNVQKTVAALGGTATREIRELNAVVIDLPQETSITAAVRQAQAIPGVRYAEPNYVYRAFQISPDDPYYATKQWGPQKIGAPQAWGVTTGSSDIVIAVLDTGISGSNDFVVMGIAKFAGSKDCVPSSTVNQNHGTHVAGIAAAVGNNGFGIAGIAWAANLLDLRVLDAGGIGTIDTIVCGINFARDFEVSNPGKRVVANMSLGGSGYSQLIKDSLDDAIGAGVVVVAAAGNDGKATVMYPAGYPGVIAVGAISPTDQRATFSTYGSHLSVVAPGVDIYSANSFGSFEYMTGTSQAAPHVAGVAALVLSQNMSLTPAQVRSQIEQTADDLGVHGFDPQFGWGRVNAARATGAPVPTDLGSVNVAVFDGGTAVADADVILWSSMPSCSNLSLMIKTVRTNASGVAIFNDIPSGNYCATASKVVPPEKKGTTLAPFTVTAGATASASVTITP